MPWLCNYTSSKRVLCTRFILQTGLCLPSGGVFFFNLNLLHTFKNRDFYIST